MYVRSPEINREYIAEHSKNKRRIAGEVTTDIVANSQTFYLQPREIIEDLEAMTLRKPGCLNEAQMKKAKAIVESGEFGINTFTANPYNIRTRREALGILWAVDIAEKRGADERFFEGKMSEGWYTATLRRNLKHQMCIMSELEPVRFDHILRGAMYRKAK